MKRAALFLALTSVTAFTYADATIPQASSSPMERDALQTETHLPQVEQQKINEDLLRKQRLTEQNKTAAQQKFIRFTGKELRENPEILERLFLESLISANKTALPVYMKLYEHVPNADYSLIDWANAILLREENLNKSVSAYRRLLSDFPENNFIRFQLAETLFYNQEYESAKTQFERLRATSHIPQDVAVFDRYLDVISSKEDWNFSFSTSFLNDKNLANSAKEGTKMSTPNGGEFTYSTPRQSGKGLALSVGADKRWGLSGGKYFALDTDLSSRYYWNNKKYNDLTAHLGLGVGYSDARFNIQFTPYINKRWYGGGLNGSDSLKQYYNTYGAGLSLGYWLNQSFKYNMHYNYGYDRYNKETDKLNYNGSTHLVSNSLLYIPSSTQYWSVSLDLMKKYAADKSNAYNRIGTRLTWGKEWPLGISTNTSVGYAKRNYREASFFRVKQKNDEYNVALSIWHKKIHYAGFTPKLTWTYAKTDSNLPIYSYDKNQLLFEVGKNF